MKQITAIATIVCLLSVGCKKSSPSPAPSLPVGTISYTYMGQTVTYTGDTSMKKEYAYAGVETSGPNYWVFDMVGGPAGSTWAIDLYIPTADSTLHTGNYSGGVYNSGMFAANFSIGSASSDSCNVTVTSVQNGLASGTFNATINNNYVSNGTFKNLYIYYNGL